MHDPVASTVRGGAVALLTLLFSGIAAAADPAAGISGDPPAGVLDIIRNVEAKPVFAHSTWGIHVADLATGEVLIEQAGGKSLVPGSIMKVYSTATALDSFGPDYRFRTPVYRLGEVDDGVLAGDLVLVASGDFSFGLREQPDGTLAFNSLPELDHNYADTGIPGGTLVKGSDPLAAIYDLAGQVKAAGIREVTGNVLVDDRLFETYRGFPDGLIAPIWVNENVIDITTTATKPGEKAHVEWRPKSAAITVEADVTTVADGGKPITVTIPRPGVIRVSGEIAADGPPTLSIAQIAEPAAFARTAFIEALIRAGIKVAASPVGAGGALPGEGTYVDANKVAEHVSPPLSEFVKVILKISYNRGADLMVCLAAVKAGSRDCVDGLTEILKLLARHGIAKSSTYVFDGAGSDDGGKTTPSDLATFLKAITAEPWGAALRDGMAILGVDGTQAENGAGTPAAGHVRVKDGARVVGSAAGQGIVLANTQAGYIDAKSGRRLVYGVFVNNVPFTSVEDFLAQRADVAAIVAAIQQGY